jgi:hypothetical protein
MGLDAHGAFEMQGLRAETLPQAPVEFRVAGFPDFMASFDSAEINAIVTKPDQRFSVTGLDIVHSAAFLRRFRMPRVKHHAVTGLKRRNQSRGNPPVPNGRDLAEVYAAFLSETRVDQLLIIDAVKPSGVEAA